MKKILSFPLIIFTLMMLIGCSNNKFDYKPSVVDHDLKDFEEVSFDLRELISNLNFNHENKRILYYNKEHVQKRNYKNKTVSQITIIDRQKYVYEINEDLRYSDSFSGFVYLDYNSSSKGSSYGYEAKVLYDNGTYAFDFHSIKKRDITTVSKGKYQTNDSFGVRFDVFYEYDSLHSTLNGIIRNPDISVSNYKLYKDSKNNYLLRKEGLDIWSLRFDESYNAISFYNYYEDVYERNTPSGEVEKENVKSEQYIIFKTNLDFSFDYSKYEVNNELYF